MCWSEISFASAFACSLLDMIRYYRVYEQQPSSEPRLIIGLTDARILLTNLNLCPFCSLTYSGWLGSAKGWLGNASIPSMPAMAMPSMPSMPAMPSIPSIPGLRKSGAADGAEGGEGAADAAAAGAVSGGDDDDKSRYIRYGPMLKNDGIIYDTAAVKQNSY